MERAVFERFCEFVGVFADAFDGSGAHLVIGSPRFGELRLELNALRRQAEQALLLERGRELVLTAPTSALLHEALCVAHACQTAEPALRALMPACFGLATRDAGYAMQQLDAYLLNRRIDALHERLNKGH
jgi:hypothetical protein